MPEVIAISITLILSSILLSTYFIQQVLRPTTPPAAPPEYTPCRLRSQIPKLLSYLWRPLSSQFEPLWQSLCRTADTIRSPTIPIPKFNKHTPRHYYGGTTTSGSAKIGHKTKAHAVRSRLRLILFVTFPFATYAFSTETTPSGPNFHVDTDSFPIKVDNCASRCITNDIRDFVSPPVKIRTHITGFAGSTRATYRGTIKWNIEDDNGTVHELVLPGSYLVKEAPFRLLSPQHWSQTVSPKSESVCTTTARDITLQWGNGQYHRTVPLDPASNTATIYAAPGLTRAHAFCATYLPDDDEADAFPTVISDDERSVQSAGSDKSDDSQDSVIVPLVAPLTDTPTDNAANEQTPPPPVEFVSIDFGVHPEMPLATDQEDEVETDRSTPTQLWVYWHHKLGHLPDKRLRQLAHNGDLPRSLLDVRPPPCASCIYGKATQKAWRTKEKQSPQRQSLHLAKLSRSINLSHQHLVSSHK